MTVTMVEVVVGSPSRWSLLAFTVQAAKMGSVPTEGDHCLSLAGEAGAEDASGLPGRNSCHRQLFSSCGGAWRVVATMVVVVRAAATMVVVEEVVVVFCARRIFFFAGVGGCHGPGVPKML